jgi:hypothetical protein
MRDARQLPPFQSPNNVFRYTIKDLCSIATQYAIGKEATELLPAPGSDKAVPSDITIQNTKKGTKGGKKRHTQHP